MAERDVPDESRAPVVVQAAAPPAAAEPTTPAATRAPAARIPAPRQSLDDAPPPPTPDPAADPTPDPAPHLTPHPAPGTAPEGTSDPALEPTPDATSEAAPETAPEGTPEPALEPAPDTTPAPALDATPEPAPGTRAEPTPAATPKPAFDATQDEPPPAEEAPADEPKPADSAQPAEHAPAGAAQPTEPAEDASAGEPEPAGPAPSAVRTRRRGRLLVAAVLLLAVVIAAGTIQLRRTLPAAHLTTTVAKTLRIPGPALSLPWPGSGSAALMIEGLGSLGGRHANTPAPIGSVAKVMTAYLILKHHPLAGAEPGPQITVTAADVADYRSRIRSGQSLVRVAAGERLTERQALEALMLPSANNVAHLLGVWDAGSTATFVAGMNEAAAALGMTRTKYTDPSGFLPSTISTPADQVRLARAALATPVFADIVAEPTATIPVVGRVKNYNDLLGRDGVFGIKTGSTSQAGGNLLFASRLELDGRPLTVVGAVFRQPGVGTPAQLAQAGTVVRRLLTSVRSAVGRYPILPVRPVGHLTTAWGATVSVRPAAALEVVGWPGMSVPVELTTSTPGAEVRSGDVVGQITARPGADSVRVDLRADTTTGDPSLWWRLARRP